MRVRNPYRPWLETWLGDDDPWRYGAGADDDRHRRALDVLPASTGRTLEVGCAEGHFTTHLAGRASRLVAVELVAAAAARAASRTAELAHVDVRRGDATRRLPLRHFDTVVCMDVLYYVPTALLPVVRGRLARRVRPGGMLLLQHQVDAIVHGWDRETGGAECLHPPFLGLGFEVVRVERSSDDETLLLRRTYDASAVADVIADARDLRREPWLAPVLPSGARWASADVATGTVACDDGDGTRRRVVVRAHGRPVAEVSARPPVDAATVAADAADLLEPLLVEPPAIFADERPPPRPPEPGTVTVAVCTTGADPAVGSLLRELVTVLPCHVEENGTAEPRLATLAADVGASYHHDPRPGLAAARNRVLTERATEWVLFLDDDVVVRPGDGARLAAALGPALDDEGLGAVTGLVLPASLDDPSDVRFERYASHRRGDRRVRYDMATSADPRWPVLGADECGVGACLAVRRAAWKEAGGFDERLGAGTSARSSEDDDFVRALIERGWAVLYDPAVVVRHRHRGDERALRAQLHGYAIGHSAHLVALAVERRDPGIVRAWARLGRKRLAERHDRPVDLWAAEVAGHVRGAFLGLALGARGRRRR